jgi:hypothetical protein
VELNLDDGGAAMMFQMHADQGDKLWSAATWRAGSNGGQSNTSHAMFNGNLCAIGARPARVFVDRVAGGDWDRLVTLRPWMDDQENDARDSTGAIHWEGAVRAFDAQNESIGRGYLGLTGYGETLRL